MVMAVRRDLFLELVHLLVTRNVSGALTLDDALVIDQVQCR